MASNREFDDTRLLPNDKKENIGHHSIFGTHNMNRICSVFEYIQNYIQGKDEHHQENKHIYKFVYYFLKKHSERIRLSNKMNVQRALCDSVIVWLDILS